MAQQKEKEQRSAFSWPAPEKRQLIGQRISRIDGPDKTTGRAKYSYDINLPGLLHAKVLTSPHAHARVTKFNVEPARKLKGVQAVYLFPEGKVGAEVQWDGQPIAAVAADTEELAADGVRAIEIEYEVLPHWVDEDDIEGARKAKRVPEEEPEAEESPEIEAAFKEADVVLEGYYGIPTITHCCWESHGSTCAWDGGKLTAYLSTQNVSGTGQEYTGMLNKDHGIETDSVEVICNYMGGGFGSKFSPDSWGVAAAVMSKQTGKPVKLMLDRATELKIAGNRPSAFAKVKIAAKKDGTIVAWESDHWGTGGISGGAVGTYVVPYVFNIPNYRRRQTPISTNTGGARAWRAPNNPQGCAVSQTALDDLAAKLGMSSLEFFDKNLELTLAAPNAKPTEQQAFRHRMEIYRKELQIGAELIGWSEKWHPRGKGGKGPVKQGLGLALHTWGGGAGNSTCQLKIHPDGRVETFLGCQDIGTGTRTVIAAVIAETLGLPISAVNVNIGRSSYPQATASGGSITVGSVSGVNRKVAVQARSRLFELASKKLAAKPEELEAVGGRIRVKGNPDKSLSWQQATALLGAMPAQFEDKHAGDARGLTYSRVGGVQMADVSVDTETGVVRMNKFVAVQDVGTIINLLCAESQVYGAAIMGIAYALSEEQIMDNATGRFINAAIGGNNYKLPYLADVGTIVVHMIQPEDGEVGRAEYDRGVVGLGEPPVISPGAAISNAVANAIGVRVPTLPLTPDKVLKALGKA